MARSKLIRFKEIEQSKIVIEQTKEIYTKMKGNWSNFFGNNHSIVLELGCGGGEYTNGLAELNTKINYIGVDIKGERIGTAARLTESKKLSNVAFLRTQIQLLEVFFGPNEVSEIWLTFPDPQPNNAKKRLTSERFLEIYCKILINGGTIHLKTDSELLLDFTLDIIQKKLFSQFRFENTEYTYDLYNSQYFKNQQGIQTRFEKIYLDKGIKIKYLRFNLVKILN